MKEGDSRVGERGVFAFPKQHAGGVTLGEISHLVAVARFGGSVAFGVCNFDSTVADVLYPGDVGEGIGSVTPCASGLCVVALVYHHVAPCEVGFTGHRTFVARPSDVRAVD